MKYVLTFSEFSLLNEKNNDKNKQKNIYLRDKDIQNKINLLSNLITEIKQTPKHKTILAKGFRFRLQQIFPTMCKSEDNNSTYSFLILSTDNSKTYSLRISNHKANINNYVKFNSSRDVNISLVIMDNNMITNKNMINNNANIPLTEIVYNEKDMSIDYYVAIVENLITFLKTGEFKNNRVYIHSYIFFIVNIR